MVNQFNCAKFCRCTENPRFQGDSCPHGLGLKNQVRLGNSINDFWRINVNLGKNGFMPCVRTCKRQRDSAIYFRTLWKFKEHYVMNGSRTITDKTVFTKAHFSARKLFINVSGCIRIAKIKVDTISKRSARRFQFKNFLCIVYKKKLGNNV